MILVELCSGLGALTLHLHGRKPPASRIGSKAGYAAAIANELGIEGPPDRAVLVDADGALQNAMWWLTQTPQLLARIIETTGRACPGHDPRRVWEWSRDTRGHGPLERQAAHWWLWTAGARGGIGGFKGRHVHRPNVDGFIPSRTNLIKRIAAFKPLPHVEVVHGWVSSVEPIPDAVVYFDPPYHEAQGYGFDAIAHRPLLQPWLDAGCTVAISERRPITGYAGARHVELTHRRVGQARRSLTTTTEEWLTIIGGP